MNPERRNAHRRRTLKEGRVIFDGSATDCVIRDLSNGGARLRFSSAFEAPSALELLIVNPGIRIRASAAWQRGNDVGVSFTR